MERRSFFKTIGVGLTGLSFATAGNSLYGAPNSLSGPEAEYGARDKNKLRLALSRADLPTETWEDIVKMEDIWGPILSDKKEAKKFSKDPGKFLSKHGIPASVMSADDVEVKIVKACIDTDIIELAAEGNYQEYIQRLNEQGILNGADRSKLREKLKESITENKEKILEQMQSMTDMDREEAMKLVDSDDLQALLNMAESGKVVVPGMLIAAAFVLLFTFAAIYISITISLAIFTFFGGVLFVGGLIYGFIEVAASGNDNARHRIAMMDPQLMEDTDIKIKVATLLGEDNFAQESYLQLVREEVSAFVEAGEESGLFQIDQDVRTEFFERIESIVCKTSGLLPSNA